MSNGCLSVRAFIHTFHSDGYSQPFSPVYVHLNGMCSIHSGPSMSKFMFRVVQVHQTFLYLKPLGFHFGQIQISFSPSLALSGLCVRRSVCLVVLFS